MTNRIIIGEDSLDPNTWVTHTTNDVCGFLAAYYDVFPETARIYHNTVSQSTDVTPSSEYGIELLSKLDGDFYVIVYPNDPITLIVAIVSVAITAAAAFLIAPKLPNSIERKGNRQSGSPNNSLSDRYNAARINERIPDIYGTVMSSPDLISPTYKTYVNHIETEHSLMCIGRGYFDIDSTTVKDYNTRLIDIAGSSIEVYPPFTSPNSGHAPQLTIGQPIDEPIFTAYHVENANAQVLRPINDSLVDSDQIYIVSPDQIRISSDAGIDFTDYFATGDNILVEEGSFSYIREDDTPIYGSGPSGTYNLLSVTRDTLTLANPSAVKNFWQLFADAGHTEGPYTHTIITNNNDKWVGPYTINEQVDYIVVNLFAPSGIYKDDGVNQVKSSVDLILELHEIDQYSNAILSSDVFESPRISRYVINIQGSSTTTTSRGFTFKYEVDPNKFYSVRIRRHTPSDRDFNGTVVDEVQLNGLFGLKRVNQNDFGNVTTVQSLTSATSGALSVKNRKLTMEVSRRIPKRNGNDFTTSLHQTSSADDIICHACLDQYIGRRNINELDIDSIYNTMQQINSNFGTSKASEFNYTFDKTNLSFEETIASICNTIFSVAYRRGSIIKLKPDIATENSTLLFNHRNKIPDTETRSVSFGIQNDHDGIELQWVDPTDDAIVSMHLPEQGTANNPKNVETIGVRNKLQAYFHAHRIWNKLQHQNITTEFNATQEADLLVVGDRVLVADNTRSNTIDGEVVEYNGLSVTLSQPFTEDGSHTIFIQHYDGSVESLQCVRTADPYIINLTSPPRLPLIFDQQMYARTVYQIVNNNSGQQNAFLVTEKNPQDNFTNSLIAVNYDSKYYVNDTDFINGVVDVDGELI